MSIYLGVNIDHIATLRQARGVNYPSVIDGALLCEEAGADGITLHLREDRRHIQDDDVWELKDKLKTKMNLEMAATPEMIKIACEVKPKDVCIVPEKREELTTEGGLDVVANKTRISELCTEMKQNNIVTSLFIASDFAQIEAAKECGAEVVEIHTGHYANNLESLENIKQGVEFAHSLGLQVNAGHGLTLQNTFAIAKLPQIVELNIGHSIIARSVFIGLKQAVIEMKQLMLKARE
jgi:pyridoxine 5-phosphate synthase